MNRSVSSTMEVRWHNSTNVPIREFIQLSWTLSTKIILSNSTSSKWASSAIPALCCSNLNRNWCILRVIIDCVFPRGTQFLNSQWRQCFVGEHFPVLCVLQEPLYQVRWSVLCLGCGARCARSRHVQIVHRGVICYYYIGVRCEF